MTKPFDHEAQVIECSKNGTRTTGCAPMEVCSHDRPAAASLPRCNAYGAKCCEKVCRIVHKVKR